MNEYTKMIVVLVLLSMISGAVLAFSYEITNAKMLEQAEIALQNAVKDVIPGAVEVEPVENAELTLFIGIDDQGNKKGVAFETIASGFGGPIEMMVGYDPSEGKIIGLEILSMQETPGLGSKIDEPDFKDQFLGKSVEDAFVVKQDVEIITGATVSSEAVSKGIKETLDKVIELYPVGGDY